jgi:uncharacterized coiled-coil protein SlyX
MGLFWDLMQQDAINTQKRLTTTLEDRVAGLEVQLQETRDLLRAVIERLEKHVRVDLNQDGRIG